MRRNTKQDKCVKHVVDLLLNGEKTLPEIKKELREEWRMGGQTIIEVIKDAKAIIKSEANDLKDISYDLNMLKLHDIADNAKETTDALSAIDKINKMVGAYTQNVDISNNIRFILGDEYGFENNFTEPDDAEGGEN